MISVTEEISIDEDELQFTFTGASGPGGQNVNKVATAVQLRFDALNSPSLTDDVRRRLRLLAGRRMTADGILIIKARRYRTQNRNRQDALERFIALIVKASLKPRTRRPTRPRVAAARQRLENKRRRSEIKRSRRPVSF
jgi:ribosome-associated protein